MRCSCQALVRTPVDHFLDRIGVCPNNRGLSKASRSEARNPPYVRLPPTMGIQISKFNLVPMEDRPRAIFQLIFASDWNLGLVPTGILKL